MQDYLRKLPKIKITSELRKDLPETPGVYIFFSQTKPIYIGKAINLKRRVSSYFDLHLEPKTAGMVKNAEELSFIKVSSELESLLLEAKLIRLYMPKYNIAAKDDKHPLYIQLTKEKYPRVITIRKVDLDKYPAISTYGPVPSSTNVRSVLKMIRRIFPYSDHKIGKRPCIYSHIWLCNPCPNIIETSTNKVQIKIDIKKYLKNIRNIKSILDGHIDKVTSSLHKEMAVASKNQSFEIAAQIRDQIERVEYITRPQMPIDFYMQNPNLVEEVRDKELKELKKIIQVSGIKILNSLKRIECFDIAHLAGTNATASMVTYINGEADKNYYRHFRIRQLKGSSDTDSLKEVIKRRLKHLDDWGVPNLIIVDGGVGQVNAFNSILLSSNIIIPVIGIAKKPDRLIVNNHKIKLQGRVLQLVTRIRDEAHRFARSYHHKLVSLSLTK